MPHLLRFLIVSFLGLAWAAAQRPTPLKVASLNLNQSQHLTLYFTGEFREYVPLFMKETERFLKDLEKKWSITLPKEGFRISLGRGSFDDRHIPHLDSPSWLQSRYSQENNRIELLVSEPMRFQLEPALDALAHQLIHHLLHFNRDNILPFYMEEGLAQFEGRTQTSHDYFRLVWTFAKQPSIRNFLTNPKTFKDREKFLSGAVLARGFVAWLWRNHEAARLPFIQNFLRGKNFEYVVAGLELDPIEDQIALYELEVRPLYRPYTLLLTYDLWLVLLGGSMLLAMLFQIGRAFRVARMKYLQIGPLEETEVEADLDEALFTGPAFEPPTPSRSRLAVDRAGLGRVGVKDPARAIKQLEGDLDKAFETILGDKAPREDRENEDDFQKGVDDDLDRVFGDWRS